ncbi:hypothetical protein, partial [Pseudomonas sp. 2822-17]|uniref:hypothetical protein n=1 Tax=Pseudomonas sp. 2822-17 TaxID=1712678 RepID=UPI001C48EEA4
MKKSFIIMLIALLVFTLVPDLRVFAKAKEHEKVIVLFKDTVDKRIITQANGQVDNEYNNVPALSISVPEVAIRGLENNPNIIAVEKDNEVTIQGQREDWG